MVLSIKLIYTYSGYLKIVVTKLWDNLETMREVAAQIIDNVTEHSNTQ